MNTNVVECFSYNISDIANITMAIASVFSLIISIANVIVIIWIFFKERNDSKEKQIHERKENWYNSLGLKDITISFSSKINELKEQSISFFNNSIEQDDYIKMYKNVDGDFLKFKNEYLTIVDCIDDSLTQKLTEEFMQIQDDLYNMVSIMVGNKTINSKLNSQDIIIQFDDIRKKIIKMSIDIYK